MELVKCGSCMYFVFGWAGEGQCHRYPKCMTKQESDFCGEFKRIEPLPELTQPFKRKPGRPRKYGA